MSSKVPTHPADSALAVERLLFGALAASVAGYCGALLGRLIFGAEFDRSDIATADASTAIAVCLLGTVWLWQRQGQKLSVTFAARVVTAVVALLALVVGWGVISVTAQANAGGLGFQTSPAPELPAIWRGVLASVPGFISVPIAVVAAVGLCLFAVGSADVFGHLAAEFPQPRIRHLRRTAWLVTSYSLVFVVGAVFDCQLEDATVQRAVLRESADELLQEAGFICVPEDLENRPQCLDIAPDALLRCSASRANATDRSSVSAITARFAASAAFVN